MSTRTSAYIRVNITPLIFLEYTIFAYVSNTYFLHIRIGILQLQVQHIDAQLLEHLQSSRQSAYLILQRENYGRTLVSAAGAA